MIWLIKFAMCTMMPRTDALPGIADTDLDGFLRKMQKESDPVYWIGLVLGALVFALTPLVTIGVPLPAFFLPKGLLERHAERILAHRVYILRQPALLVRLSAGMCWGADSAVRAHFNLPPYGPDPGTFRTT
ncbi:MAG TPA: hypothetical protein VK540_14765 [Polyangiaceae bacterium]|nr:hypothetical protein [Polyangiaceae bacterium]